jgi:hypothetical protein
LSRRFIREIPPEIVARPIAILTKALKALGVQAASGQQLRNEDRIQYRLRTTPFAY